MSNPAAPVPLPPIAQALDGLFTVEHLAAQSRLHDLSRTGGTADQLLEVIIAYEGALFVAVKDSLARVELLARRAAVAAGVDPDGT